MTTSAEPRIRFNWGFWDAQSGPLPEWWTARAKHFDRIYVNGYEYGLHSKDQRPTTSDEAWADYTSAIKEAAAQRKAIKNARPALFSTRY